MVSVDQQLNNSKSLKAFSIIELMVVVTIIGLLAGSALLLYSKSQQRSRDALRVQDLSAIWNALGIYKEMKAKYPAESSSQCSGSLGAAQDFETSSVCGSSTNWQTTDPFYSELSSNQLMKKIPADPLNTYDNQYYYEPWGRDSADCQTIDCVQVLLFAPLENSTGSQNGYCITDRNKNSLDNFAGHCDNIN